MNKLILLFSIFSIALACEFMWPLRKETRSKVGRIAHNLGLAAISALFVRYAFFPFEIWAAEQASSSNLGLLGLTSFQPWLKIILGFLLLEYFHYWWHRLNHHSAFLWRFHNVHHIDRDLDVSTASRFHFGELAFSSLFRVGEIYLLGIDVQTLILFESSVTAFALFHHSNIRFPKRLESFFMTAFITPRIHGIHHSIVKEETDSNYGTVFTFWDRLHGTKKTNIPQNEITIGVPAYMNTADHLFLNVLTTPFRPQRKWRMNDGTIPQRGRFKNP